MTKIQWDKAGEKTFETGVDHGVLYPAEGGLYPKGVPWNGLTTVTESPSGAEASPQYADNQKYLNLTSAEEFGGTIEAFTSPKEFDACDGTKEAAPGVTIGQQGRQNFGFSYRTKVGNDVEGQDYAYKLHLVYGAQAAPSEKAYATVNDSPEAIAFSWEFTTTPVDPETKDENGKDLKPTATLVIDSRTADPAKLAALEVILYGAEGAGDGSTARLPMPKEVIEMFGGAASVQSFSSLSEANDQ